MAKMNMDYVEYLKNEKKSIYNSWRVLEDPRRKPISIAGEE